MLNFNLFINLHVYHEDDHEDISLLKIYVIMGII